MNFWLKYFHIVAMAVWFTGLFLLPRLYLASRRDDADHAQINALGGALFFGLVTPAAAITVVIGLVLITYGFEGPWLPAKLTLVALAVLLHVYLGQLLIDLSARPGRHSDLFYRALSWCPLLLLLAIAALAAAKPRLLPPLGGL